MADERRVREEERRGSRDFRVDDKAVLLLLLLLLLRSSRVPVSLVREKERMRKREVKGERWMWMA